MNSSTLNLVVATTGWWVAAFLMVLGNTAGYHRLLTHRSFETSAAIRAALTLLSALHSGSPAQWVGLHRAHHAFSDSEMDAHSPRHGFWFAHCGWLFFGLRRPLPCMLLALSGFGLQGVYLVRDLRRLAGRLDPKWRALSRDLMKEPLIAVLDRPLVIPALFTLQLSVAWAMGGGWGLLWLWSLHVVLNNLSWVINSVCHWPGFGSQAEGVGDGSRNVAWLGWITLGDSFHSHHHRHPNSACHALDGGADMSWWFIVGLKHLGLARNVKLPPGHQLPAWVRRPA